MMAMARVGQVGVEAAKDSSVTMENRADTAGGEAAVMTALLVERQGDSSSDEVDNNETGAR